MFKLAWRESLMAMWRRAKEHKAAYVLEILAVFFYYLLIEGEISYSMLWIGWWTGIILTQGLESGNEKIFPDIFNYVPINQEQKKKYKFCIQFFRVCDVIVLLLMFIWMMSEVENFGLTASGAWMKYRLELLIFCGFLLYVAISIAISVCYIRASMRRLEV